jgi:hypothetical protein
MKLVSGGSGSAGNGSARPLAEAGKPKKACTPAFCEPLVRFMVFAALLVDTVEVWLSQQCGAIRVSGRLPKLPVLPKSDN